MATTIGIYFDGHNGTLTYYKDGVSLGPAFDGLQEVEEPLYPVVCSTAAKTEMALGVMKREFLSLQVPTSLTMWSLTELDEITYPEIRSRSKIKIVRHDL